MFLAALFILRRYKTTAKCYLRTHLGQGAICALGTLTGLILSTALCIGAIAVFVSKEGKLKYREKGFELGWHWHQASLTLQGAPVGTV